MRTRILNRASDLAGIRRRCRVPSIRGGYGMYYTQIRSNAVAGYLTTAWTVSRLIRQRRADRISDLPDLCAGQCRSAHHSAAVSCRHATSRSWPASGRFTRHSFSRYGLNFDLLPNYPDELVNPRSQVVTIGFEREFFKRLYFWQPIMSVSI